MRIILIISITLICIHIESCTYTQKLNAYGSTIIKYDAIASNINITYNSPQVLFINSRFANYSSKSLDSTERVKQNSIPVGGIINFTIPYNDSTRYQFIRYEIKQNDSTIIYKRRGEYYGRLSEGGTFKQNVGSKLGVDSQGKTTFVTLPTYYDSLHIPIKITGNFDLYIYNSSRNAKQIQKYTIQPDTKQPDTR